MPTTSRVLTRRNALLAAVAMLACVAGLLAACGGRSGNDAGTTPGGGSGANGLQAYLTCLNQNGVSIQLPSGRPSGATGAGGFPSGGVRPSGAPGGRPGGGGLQQPAGVDDATWQKAQQACASLRPTGGPGGQNGQDNGALSAYRDCLSNHGVTASAGIGQLDGSDPTVAAAQQACAALLPTAAPSASSNG
jgi:hypothetical protein